MSNRNQKKPVEFAERIRHLERENKRLQRAAKRYETQLQQLDKMAKANEKININLYSELEVLSKQAEAQAREAQIEAALERVRTRAMAMSSSDDLADAVAVVFQEVEKLGISTIRCGISIIDAANKTMDVWIATTTEKGQEAKASGGLKIAGNPKLKKVFDAWKRGDPFLSYKLTGQALDSYYKSIAHDLPLPEREAYHRKQVVSLFFFAEGGLYTYTAEPLSAEASQVFEKFTRVFALTYRRYLDLKQAEEQAREAQIEATLERIRNRTLLMKDSGELNEAVAVFFQQFKSLDLLPAEARTYFCHVDASTKTAEVWMTHADGTVMSGSHFTPLNQSPSLKKFYQAWKRQQSIHVRNYSGEALKEYLQFVSTLPHVKGDKDYRRLFKSQPDRIVMTDANFLQGCIGIMTFEPLSQEALNILVRFAKVFEFTYTRFLDLQKAEAQAREAQIEAALERVRARSMAMHTSDELTSVAEVVFAQFQDIEIATLRRIVIAVMNSEDHTVSFWASALSDQPGADGITTPMRQNPKIREISKRWLAKEDRFSVFLKKQAVENFIKHILQHGWQYPAGERPPDRMVMNCASYSHGVMIAATYEPLGAADWAILARFAKVFEQAYTRFLDLQKAEAQAREAQIEAALERVRAKAMAMHSSDDISDATAIVFSELEKLGIVTLRCGIVIIHETKQMDVWTATATAKQKDVRVIGRLDTTIHPALKGLFEAWKKRRLFYLYELAGKDMQDYYKAIERAPDYPIPEQDLSMPRQLLSAFNFPEGALFAFTEDALVAETTQIFKRFASVFALTYRRYLDLKQAEEQAREAEIEAALERVRAASMAMHKSGELLDVVRLLFNQLADLGLKMDVSLIYEFIDDVEDHHFWGKAGGQNYTERIHLPYFKHPYFLSFKTARTEGTPFITNNFSKRQKDAFFTHYFEKSSHRTVPQKRKDYIFSCEGMNQSIALTKNTTLAIFRYNRVPFSEEENDILKRMAHVFEQSYTRFLDLQKAEAQAREAQIEAALERVRARAMGMHHSDELSHVVATVFEELKQLDFALTRCLIWIFDPDTVSARWWMANSENPKGPESYYIKCHEHAAYQAFVSAWNERNPKWVYDLHGDTKASWLDFLFTETELTRLPAEVQAGMRAPDRVILSASFNNFGALQTAGLEPLSDENLEIVRRFGRVFDMTYTRFHDLKQAEARAREAERQSSLDRVRAEIASMRTADDLNRITPLIWRELTTLGVPFFRCGVFIIDEASEQTHAYLSTPAGKSLAALHLKFDSTALVEQTVLHWREGKTYREEWDREQFIEWTQTILSQGLIESPEKYQAGEEAPEKLVLQLVPFKQGMLYVGSTSPLSEDEIDTVGSLADAFAVAYARYEDFQRLEAAKAEVETAFKELGILSNQLEAKNAELEAENERKARELEEARRVQLAMLPKTVPSLPDLQIAVYMKTATEVGGDYYDFHVAKDGTLTVVVGDATGHGLKAGTMVTVAKSLFSSLADQPDIVSTFTAMSTSIKAMKLPLLSMCLAMLKIKNGKMKLSSAGIPPPLIYRKSSKTVEEVVISGMPLGAMAGFPYRQKEITLQPSDTILLMSDGFPERMNDKEQMFDYPRAQEAFADVAAQAPRKIVKHLVKACDGWANGRAQDDDVTFVVIRYTI